MKTALSLRLKDLKDPCYLILWSGFCTLLGAALGIYAESPILILLVLAIIGTLVFMAMDVALYALLICFPFSFRYILPGQTEVQTPTEPLLGMLVFAFIIRQILDRVIRTEQSHQNGKSPLPPFSKGGRGDFPFAAPVLFYMLATFLSTVNSPQLYTSSKGAIRSVAYMMLSFLTYALIKRPQDLRRLFVSTFPSAIVAVVWTVIVIIEHIDQWQWRSAYEGSPFTNYTVYGSFTAVFLLIVLSRLLLDRTAYDRVLWTGLFVIFGFGLIMCFARGVWLSVIVALGFLLMQLGTGEGSRKILFVGAISIFIFVILSLPGISELIINRISSAFSLRFASNRVRLMLWGQALLMFLQHPIIGNGYGAFGILHKQDASLVGTYTAQFQLGAHSEYLQVLAELGIVGFAVWVWVIIAFFRYGRRALSQIEAPFYRSLIVGLMAAELSMLVLFTVNSLPSGDELSVPFWVIYGLLPAVVNMATQQKQAEAMEGMGESVSE